MPSGATYTPTPAGTTTASGLPDIHNDPFDRILAATAIVHRLELLSKDTVLPRYPGLTVVW